jgi:ketosteroid isomerase-like protein
MPIYNKAILRVALAAGAMAAALPASAQPPARSAPAPLAAQGSVQRAASDFVSAFNALDEARFDAAWAEDATLFFPGAVPGRGGGRFTGKTEVLGVFHAFFAAIRKSRSGPNYLNIRPQDLHVQDYGEVAIVSFHLAGDNAIGRRTLVMRKAAGTWRIAHMHASSIQTPPAVAPAEGQPKPK